MYAEISGGHYLLDVKGNDRVDDAVVPSKRVAAEQWARFVTDDGGQGRWQYLLVPRTSRDGGADRARRAGRSRAARC